MIYLYAILNLAIVIIVKAFYDKSQFAKGVTISHPKEWAIAGLCSLPAIYLLGHETGKWYGYIAAIFVCMAFIWLFFDALLNTIRGFALNYAGTITKNSAWWDKQLNKVAPKWRMSLKLICLSITVIVYVLCKMLSL